MSDDSVECPRCGEEFDLWASGGYCTNPDCGAQHPQAKSDGTDDASDASDAGNQTDSPDTTDSGGSGGGGGGGSSSSDDDLVECGNCGSQVDGSFAFCAECGNELTEAEEDDVDDDPGTVECPGCGTESSSEFEFCSNCGTELPDPGATGGGADPPADDEDDASTPVPGDDDSDPTVEIEVAGERMSIAHGDIIGGEVREALVANGTDRDEARYIHREHVEFELRDDGVYVIDHGRNTTTVDGESLSEGDETMVSDGSSLELSGIAKVDVHIT